MSTEEVRVLVACVDAGLRRRLRRALDALDEPTRVVTKAEEFEDAVEAGVPPVVLLEHRFAPVGRLVRAQGHGVIPQVVVLGEVGGEVSESELEHAFAWLPVDAPLAAVRLTVRRALASETTVAPPFMDRPLLEVLGKSIKTVLRTSQPALIVGEAGTGKTELARELHRRGSNSGGPFVVVEAADLDPARASLELFGEFEGSGRLGGRFGAASGGTLVLRHLELLPSEALSTLQAVLKRKPGEQFPQVLVTARPHWRYWVERGRLPKALVDSLTQRTVEIPPLRERAEDVPWLAQHVLDDYAELQGRPLTLLPAALERLQRYLWPGNFRELTRVLDRLASSARGVRITPEAVDAVLGEGLGLEAPIELIPLREMERRLFVEGLRRFGGDKPAVARTLGVALKTVYNKIKAYEIDVE